MSNNKTDIDIQNLEWNRVYKNLTESQVGNNSHESLVGKIAYSKYIDQKYAFIQENIEKNNCNPTAEEIIVIIKLFEQKGAIQSLRNDAKYELEEYTNNLVYSEIKKYLNNKRNFVLSIGASIIGAFIYSFIIALAIFSSTYGDPESRISRALDALISQEVVTSKGLSSSEKP